MPVGNISESDITYGQMPESDYEIVIKLDPSSDLISVGDPSEYIGQPVRLKDMSQMQTYQFDSKIKVAGIIVGDGINDNDDYGIVGYSTIYTSDKVGNELLISMMAASSKTELNFNGTRVSTDYERGIYSSEDVPDGKVYLFEDQVYYYDNEEAVGKPFSLKVKNRFFESEGEYTVDKVINEDNCNDLLGIPEDELEMYYNCVFISENDFRELFDRGFYQISAYMINEQEAEETQQMLNDEGFTVLAMKDALTDETGGLGNVLSLMTYVRLAVEFVILFFIAYAVIRLIMRSRNSYYSTLRILGATKSNTNTILRVELILMMLIAYGTDLLFVTLVKNGILQDLVHNELKEVTKLLYYLTPADYGILGAVLLFMSILIANRYSRHIFTKSAMKAFREGA